jgi:hypothetical protein
MSSPALVRRDEQASGQGPHNRWDPVTDDLALNAPGQASRAQASTAKQAAPVRTMLARILRVHTDERAWRLGADGEEKVAASLTKLIRKDPRWRVLHAIPVGESGADIDHLVVGPGGVLSLNAKHHPGAKVWVADDVILVNGQRQPYVRNSRHEAARASRLLSAACSFPVQVTGVVVPVNASDITIRSAPQGVHVVGRRRLARWLRRRDDVLDEQTVAAIFEVARRPATWRP